MTFNYREYWKYNDGKSTQLSQHIAQMFVKLTQALLNQSEMEDLCVNVNI